MINETRLYFQFLVNIPLGTRLRRWHAHRFRICPLSRAQRFEREHEQPQSARRRRRTQREPGQRVERRLEHRQQRRHRHPLGVAAGDAAAASVPDDAVELGGEPVIAVGELGGERRAPGGVVAAVGALAVGFVSSERQRCDELVDEGQSCERSWYTFKLICLQEFPVVFSVHGCGTYAATTGTTNGRARSFRITRA